MNIRTSILYLCITFSVFFTNQDAYAKKVSFEGWFVQPDIAGILPIWVELEVSNNGNIQGWFCYRIDGEKSLLQGTVDGDDYSLSVPGTKGKYKEVLTFSKDADSLTGEWKKGNEYMSLTLYDASEDQEQFIPLQIKTNFSKMTKKHTDSIVDIEYLMVRKGLVSVKVYHSKASGTRDWASYHTIDLQKNKEINLLEYVDANAFKALKIVSDNYAELQAREQLESLTTEDIMEMVQCGFSKEDDFHFDAVVLYPHKTGITLYYQDLFGLDEACLPYIFPIEYEIPLKDFTSCIKKGSLLTRFFH